MERFNFCATGFWRGDFRALVISEGMRERFLPGSERTATAGGSDLLAIPRECGAWLRGSSCRSQAYDPGTSQSP